MINDILLKLTLGAVITIIVSLISYFLKKQNEKIESIDVKLKQMSDFFVSEIKLTKKEVVSLFHEICHERQNSCATLMQTRIESVQKQQTLLCHKIDAMRVEQREAWSHQNSFNDITKEHLIKYKGKNGN
jgi:Na+-transporting NADH:ubiquinone oxidoreductase subunit NqrC